MILIKVRCLLESLRCARNIHGNKFPCYGLYFYILNVGNVWKGKKLMLLPSIECFCLARCVLLYKGLLSLHYCPLWQQLCCMYYGQAGKGRDNWKTYMHHMQLDESSCWCCQTLIHCSILPTFVQF